MERFMGVDPVTLDSRLRGNDDILTSITDNLDVWTTAETPKKAGGRGRGAKTRKSPHGIKKLRELILELAVRGKLVPQDPNDEPVSVLLEKIATEKTRLIKEGCAKKQKPLLEINKGEVSFDLPQNWAWSRLGEISEFINGFAFKSSDFQDNGVGIIKIGDIQNGEVSTRSMSRVDFSVVEDLDDSLKVNEGDMLIAMSGATTGKLGFNKTGEVFYINQRVGKITPFYISTEYLYYPLTTKVAENLAKSMGSAIPNLSTGQIKNIVIGLPPLAEQYRIVAKVDELMALCDVLEQEQTDSSEAHKILVETLLATLTQAEDNNEFRAAWSRIAEHFDTLFTTERSIDQLKQTILQLAVMGKLAPQNPNDEPASALLKKIAAEKASLIKEKKIKKQKLLQGVSEEERPFDLPRSWEWVRLDEITSKITDGDHKTPPRITKGYRLLSAKNVRDGFLDFDNCDFIAEEYYLKSRERCCPESNDLLIVSVGGTIGRTSLVPNNSSFALVRSVALIKPLFINSWFLKYAMDSELLQDSIHARKRGGAQPCLYLSEIRQFHFSLPPLAEQHRIVAKVDELMVLCDSLKDRLKESQTTQVQLADAIVEQAVG